MNCSLKVYLVIQFRGVRCDRMHAAARRDRFHRRLSGCGTEPLTSSMVFRSYFRVWVVITIHGTILEVGVTDVGGSRSRVNDGSHSSYSLPNLRFGLPTVVGVQRRTDDEQAGEQRTGMAQSAV